MKYGISASIIRSDAGRLNELFWEGTGHIEIGSLPHRSAFGRFFEQAAGAGTTVGIHSPLLYGGSRRDLAERVDFPSERAWDQVEDEAKYAGEIGAAYLLVHFPYFSGDPGPDAETVVGAGLERLAGIQRRSGCPIVCEPKLGADRHTGGVDLLRTFPVGRWADADIRMCWDIGDFLIGTRDGADHLAQLDRWLEVVSVVHLHNTQRGLDQYRWVPAHERLEDDPDYYPLAPSLRRMAGRDITIVLEHTPNDAFDAAFVDEGLRWVKRITQKGNPE